MAILKVLLLGDLFGKTGRDIFARHIKAIKEEYAVDAVIVNGENSADGKGITPDIAVFFKKHGVDVITTGNHVWDKKEILLYMAEHVDVLRPANYPDECPGTGVTFFKCKGHTIAVMNLMGRAFMPVHLDCPFKKAEKLLPEIHERTKTIFVDFHAEATAEKLGLAYFIEGKVSAVVGTHTHVQTADERILPGGTAYITDLGMGGSLNSMIGATKEPLIQRFLNQMPVKHGVDLAPPYVISGVVVTVDTDSGKALAIERVYKVDNESL